MQVRPVEFQENFRKVALEGARQQSVLQKEPEVAQQQAAQAAANEQALAGSRPNPTTETEGKIIDPASRRPPEGSPRHSQDRGSEEEQGSQEQGGEQRSGGRIDIVA